MGSLALPINDALIVRAVWGLACDCLLKVFQTVSCCLGHLADSSLCLDKPIGNRRPGPVFSMSPFGAKACFR